MNIGIIYAAFDDVGGRAYVGQSAGGKRNKPRSMLNNRKSGHMYNARINSKATGRFHRELANNPDCFDWVVLEVTTPNQLDLAEATWYAKLSHEGYEMLNSIEP